jgi:hypothetical protein
MLIKDRVQTEGITMFRLAVCLIFITTGIAVAQGLEKPLAGEENVPLSTRVNLRWKDVHMPWGYLTPAPGISEILDELVLPEVSGKDMAAEANTFREAWDEHLEERRAIASGLGRLAREYEEVDQFDKALMLYEKLWEVFPEQSDVVNEIKWEYATREVRIDLSSAGKAFISLKRALLTYELTAAAFGIVDAGTVLYKPMPVELSDLDTCTNVEEMPDTEPEEDQWPKAAPNAWWDAARYEVATEIINVKVQNATKLDVIELLQKKYGVAVVLTPAARHTLAEDSRRLTIKFRDVPPREVLKYVLRPNESDVQFVERLFSILVYDRRYDKPDRLVTAVLQPEPWGIFPDEHEACDESRSKEARTWLEDFLGESLGIDKFPDEWETYFGCVGMLKAPVEVIGAWYSIITSPSAGEYFGCALPLLRCLRAYPLVGAAVDRYEGHPRERYQYVVQSQMQTQRMHCFLNNRSAIIGLLRSELLGVKQHAENRYEPHITSGWIGSLSSRIGLWFDGSNYRFLIFDSKEARDGWFKGEDWVDVPSDIDKHDWPTQEEWQERLRREKEEDEKQLGESAK